MDGAREYNARWNKPVRERQIPYNFIYTWNLRNKTEEHKGREGKIKDKMEANHKRLLTIGNKLRVAGGNVRGGWGNWVMGIKESAWCNEHWVLYATDESLNSTCETNNTLCVS